MEISEHVYALDRVVYSGKAFMVGQARCLSGSELIEKSKRMTAWPVLPEQVDGTAPYLVLWPVDNGGPTVWAPKLDIARILNEPNAAVNLVGREFGHLTVIGQMEKSNKRQQRLWACRCECGRVRPLATGELTSGKYKSCGCANGRTFGATTLEERFWAKVNKESGVFRLVNGVSSECWVWTGAVNEHGYGKFYGPAKKAEKAPRIALLLAGQLFPGLVLHLCDNPPCVRPDHLIMGTHADNSKHMVERGRSWNSQKTHCPNGHVYTADNIVRWGNGDKKTTAPRRCKICETVRVEKRRLARIESRLA